MILEIIFCFSITTLLLIFLGALTYILMGKSKTFDDAVKQFITDTKNIFVGVDWPPQQKYS